MAAGNIPPPHTGALTSNMASAQLYASWLHSGQLASSFPGTGFGPGAARFQTGAQWLTSQVATAEGLATFTDFRAADALDAFLAYLQLPDQQRQALRQQTESYWSLSTRSSDMGSLLPGLPSPLTALFWFLDLHPIQQELVQQALSEPQDPVHVWALADHLEEVSGRAEQAARVRSAAARLRGITH